MQNHLLKITDYLPPAQKDGAVVIGLVSATGGTGKTLLSAGISRATPKALPEKRGVLIDLTCWGDLCYHLDIAEIHQRGIEHLYSDIHQKQGGGFYSQSIDLLKYIRPINSHMDILTGGSSKGVDQTYFDILPPVISMLRKEYDFVLVDTPSGWINYLMPILATVNYLLIPFNIWNWRPQLHMLKHTNEIILELKYLGYPISIGGIIPTNPYSQLIKTSQSLNALRQLFGRKVWPLVNCASLQRYVSTQQEDRPVAREMTGILNRFSRLLDRKPPCMKGVAIERRKLVFKCIDDSPQEPLPPSKITESLQDIWPGIKEYQVLRDIKQSLFRNRPLPYCEDRFAKLCFGPR